MATDEEDYQQDSTGYTLALAATLSAIFFFGSYIVATIVSEVLGRRGLPWAPLVYAIVFFPVALLVALYEDRLQHSRHWHRLERYWYHAIAAAGCLVPPIVTVFFGQTFWQSLPRGGGVGVAITATILAGGAVLLSGSPARRRHSAD